MDSSLSIKKVTLVQPSILLPWDTCKYVWPPMGILYLSASLKKHGYKVNILDSILNGYESEHPYDQESYILGLTPSELAASIIKTQPDLVGFSVTYPNQFPLFIQTCKLLKQQAPDLFILAGGALVTLRGESMMSEPSLDGLLCGMAEDTILEFLEWMQHPQEKFGVDGGIVRRAGGRIDSNPLSHKAPGFNNWPWPDRDAIDLEAYFALAPNFQYTPLKSRAVGLVTSRGCPGNCVFCSNPTLSGRRYYPRPAPDVVDEIEYLVDQLGVEEIQIYDSNWTLTPDRGEAMLDLVMQRGLKFNWMAQNTSIYAMSDSLLAKMAKTGCYKVRYSIESASQRILKDLIRKPIDLDKSMHIVKESRRLGMLTGVNFVLGFPDETKKEIMHTVDYAKKLDADFTLFSPATPFDHTELTDIAISMGLLPADFEYNVVKTGRLFWDLPDLDRDEFQRIRQQAWDECNFATPEKEARFHKFMGTNFSCKPVNKPK